jgi:Domain of unknown function (DUF3560)
MSASAAGVELREGIAITHTAGEGTLVLGTQRGDGTAAVLRRHGFRWSTNIGAAGAWYLPQSRDRAPRQSVIDQVADQLRTAGFTVGTAVDPTARTTAEVESDRAIRLSGRADALSARAGRLEAVAGAAHDDAHAMAEAIPFGQPVLVDHYSAGRDLRYRARMGAKMDKAVATSRAAQETARRADASRANEQRRLTAGATRRRISRLEADERALARRARRDDHAPDLARVEDELSHWRAHLARLEAAGVKLWGPGDFRRGDRVNGSCTVVRVNTKSLTVQHDVWGPGHTHPLPYDRVRSMERPA